MTLAISKTLPQELTLPPKLMLLPDLECAIDQLAGLLDQIWRLARRFEVADDVAGLVE